MKNEKPAQPGLISLAGESLSAAVLLAPFLLQDDCSLNSLKQSWSSKFKWSLGQWDMVSQHFSEQASNQLTVLPGALKMQLSCSCLDAVNNTGKINIRH